MTDGMVFTGKTVEDAVADGLRSLGLAQEQVEVEVISRGSRGLFGIGSEPAQVRLTPRQGQRNAAAAQETAPAKSAGGISVEPPASSTTVAAASALDASAEVWPANPAERAPAAYPAAGSDGARDMEAGRPAVPPAAPRSEEALDNDDTAMDEAGGADREADAESSDAEMEALAVELLHETVRLMGFEAEVVASWEEPDADNDEPYLLLNLHGRDLGALIGRRGETLGNLQYLLRLMVNQRLHQWKNIVVDVEQYRQHRAEHLMQLALRSADQVTNTGRPLSLEPMPPNERRIIHLALRDHPSVYTESSGEGERRKIQIVPRRSS
jgi:spoIIIJ-associated protein